MHVGFSLLTLFPGRVGGSETNVQGLLQGFAHGHGPQELTILGNRHVGAEYAGWPVRQVPAYRCGDSMPTRFVAMNLGRLWPRIDGREFDVVHYPVTVPVPSISGPPRVVTLLDVQHHELPHMFSRAERHLRSWAYDGSARGADLVVTISEHAKQGIIDHVGVAAHRIEVIGLGVDHARYRPEGPTRDDLGDYVLYPANMWPHKNHGRLLEAWRRVDTTLTLVLTGQTFGRHVSGERVLHLGHVAADEMPALYRSARAVVFPSLFEGFGVPVLEAMASGTPVATSSRGALAEVAGTAAELFDPEDVEEIRTALERLIGDERLRDRLRVAGLRRSADFTWEQAAKRHCEAYVRAASRE